MTTDLPPPPPLPRWNSFRLRDRIRELLSPGDSAHELALGASVGMFVAFTPLFGLHLVLIVVAAFVLQRLVRFNKALAIAASYVNNPLTFAPMLWASYKAGAVLVPTTAGASDQGPLLHELNWHAGVRALPQLLHGIGWPMLLGCLVLGVVSAVAVYPVTYGMVTWHRRGKSVADSDAASRIDASAATTPLPVTSRFSHRHDSR